jgi:hypothetical protein
MESMEATMRTRSSLLALGLMVTLGAAAAHAGDREFHEIVQRLSAAYQKKPMPFMGFVSLVGRFAEPEGVSGLRIAIFSDVDASRHLDAAGFDAFVQGVAGADYHSLVRVRSGHDSDQTYIYVREAKGGYEMLVVNLDPSDAVVVKMHLNPKAMEGWMDKPVDHGKDFAHQSHFDERD